MVQWLGLHGLTAKGAGSIPGRGTKVPQATQCDQKKRCGIYIYIYIYMEYHSAIKKEWNIPICSTMDGPTDYRNK